MTTVNEHLARAVESGILIDLSRLVTAERQTAIEAVIAKVGPDLLKPIKEQLDESFSYDEIRLVRASSAAVPCFSRHKKLDREEN